MTERLYDIDSHIKEFEATVVDCVYLEDKYAVILDKTAFFPGGGGQEHDDGELNGEKILDVYEKDNVIYHIISTEIEKGKRITGKLDYDKRFKNMQNHSGEHLVTGIIHNLYGFDNVGFHMGSDCITLDINGELTNEQLKEIEILSNKVIYENVGISISYPKDDELEKIKYRSKLDLKENVRIVTIDGYDKCACCAPHVMKTGEIGIIKIIGSEKMKDKMRISMLSGYDALYDYRKKFDNAHDISVLLSIKPNETYEGVKKLYNELNDKNFEIVGLKRELFTLKYKDMKKDGNIVIFEDDISINELIYIANLLSENNSGYIAALSQLKNGGFNYVIKHKSINLREKIREINSLLDGRGGGKEEMVQGFFNSDKKDIEKVLTNL